MSQSHLLTAILLQESIRNKEKSKDVQPSEDQLVVPCQPLRKKDIEIVIDVIGISCSQRSEWAFTVIQQKNESFEQNKPYGDPDANINAVENSSIQDISDYDYKEQPNHSVDNFDAQKFHRCCHYQIHRPYEGEET